MAYPQSVADVQSSSDTPTSISKSVTDAQHTSEAPTFTSESIIDAQTSPTRAFDGVEEFKTWLEEGRAKITTDDIILALVHPRLSITVLETWQATFEVVGQHDIADLIRLRFFNDLGDGQARQLPAFAAVTTSYDYKEWHHNMRNLSEDAKETVLAALYLVHLASGEKRFHDGQADFFLRLEKVIMQPVTANP